jgi:hypothetical protein
MRDRRTMHPYARVLDRHDFGSLDRLDRRTHAGRVARDLTAALVQHIGGEPTIAQKLLIERIVKMKLQLDGLGDKLETGEWTAHDVRTYGGLSNAYRLTLRELDRMKSPKKAEPSLEEVIAEHRRAPNAGG